jgi:hypothetical protein
MATAGESTPAILIRILLRSMVLVTVSYLFRSLGQVVALSVGGTIMQNTLRSSLHKHFSGGEAEEVGTITTYSSPVVYSSWPPQIVRRVRESLRYVDELDSVTRAIVRSSYEDAIHVMLWFMVALAAAAAFFSFFIKEKSLATPRGH